MTNTFLCVCVFYILLIQVRNSEGAKNWRSVKTNADKSINPENFEWSFVTDPRAPLLTDPFKSIPSPDLYLWDDDQHKPKHQHATRYSVKTKISLSESEQDEPRNPNEDVEDEEDDDDDDEEDDDEYNDQIPVTTPRKLIDNYAEYELPRQQQIQPQIQPSAKGQETKSKNPGKESDSSTKTNTLASAMTNVKQQLPIIQLSANLQHVPIINQTKVAKLSSAVLPKTDYKYTVEHSPVLVTTTKTSTSALKSKKRGRQSRIQVLPILTQVTTPKRASKTTKIPSTTSPKTLKLPSKIQLDLEYIDSAEIDLNPMSAPNGNFGARIKIKDE